MKIRFSQSILTLLESSWAHSESADVEVKKHTAGLSFSMSLKYKHLLEVLSLSRRLHAVPWQTLKTRLDPSHTWLFVHAFRSLGFKFLCVLNPESFPSLHASSPDALQHRLTIAKLFQVHMGLIDGTGFLLIALFLHRSLEFS